jgi:uncharacterized protein
MKNNIFRFLSLLLIISGVFFVLNLYNTSVDEVDIKTFFWCLLFGAIASFVKSSLGVGYGPSVSSFLMGYGIPPIISSAYVHISEIFTSGSSALNHWKIGNLDLKLFRRIFLPGFIGSIAGIYLISKIKIPYLSLWIALYLLIVGFVLLNKVFDKISFSHLYKIKKISPLAAVVGCLDVIAGGGWGAILTSTLLKFGYEPKKVIASVNTAQFFLSAITGVSLGFLVQFVHWEAIAGLILSGIVMSPIAAKISSKIKPRIVIFFVASIIIFFSLRTIFLILS